MLCSHLRLSVIGVKFQLLPRENKALKYQAMNQSSKDSDSIDCHEIVFYGIRDSLSCSQEPATGPCSEQLNSVHTDVLIY